MGAPANDHAGVLIPPPVLYLVPLLLGAWLHRRSPWPLMATASTLLILAGVLIAAAGLALDVAAVTMFRRRGTTVLPALRPTTAVVGKGPYRFTRNPMYLGLTLVYVGISLALNTIWPLLFLPAVLFVMDRYVIRREERYLSSKFGDEYEAYRRDVRRWL